MSYCGTCGKFYTPDCVRAREGLCAPAPNPYEERAVNLFALAVVMNAKVAGMVTANQAMMARQMPPPYGKIHFDQIADLLEKEIGQ